MPTLSIRGAFRPIRVGWCIGEDEFEDFRQAVRLTSTLWGGRFNPIILIGRDVRFAETLVKTFRVDLLYPITETAEVNAFLQKFPYLIWPDAERSLFVSTLGGYSPFFLDVYHALRRIRESGNAWSGPVERTVAVRTEPLDPLKDVLLATFGDYPPPPLECPVDYGEMARTLVGLELKTLQPTDSLSGDAWKKLTPISISEYGLLVYSPGSGGQRAGVFIGAEDSLPDLAQFWNLRAADIELYFLPERNWQRCGPMIQSWVAEVKHQLSQNKVPSERRFGIWSNRDRTFNTYKPIVGEGYTIHVVTPRTWNGLIIRPPRTHFEKQSILANLDERAQKVSVSFSVPKKPLYDEAAAGTENLILAVEFPVEPGAGGQTFDFPPVPELNEYYGRNACAEYDRTRVGPDGLGLIVRSSQDHLTIHALSPNDLIARILGLAGVNAQPSTAGRVGRRVIAHMGGLEDCRVFKIRGVRQLLTEFGPTQSFSHDQALSRIGPGFDAYKNLYIEDRKSLEFRPQDAFLYLIQRKVLRTGVDLECGHCDLPGWYSIDDLRDEINCQFCGKTFSSSPQLRDRVWAYRLSGVFARTRDHEGALPVAMTLLQFKRSSMFQPFTYTCGMDLEWAEPGNQVKVETDFVVIRRNRDDQPIVLLGECKNNKSLCSPDEQEKVERLIKVGDKLRDVGIDSFITFSKAGGPFTPEELDFLDQKQTIHLNFVLLSPEELEPYSPYEVSLAARKVRLATPMSLEEWAANSQQLYLKTKPEEVFEKWRASKVEGASS